MFEAPPTVNAEQIRKFYNNVKSNQNKPAIHAKYDYYQPDSIQEQLNEFISYTEVQNDLADYQEEYNSTYPQWKNCNLQKKKEIIANCFDHLDFIHDEERVNAAKCLSYISLGNYGDCEGEQQNTATEKKLQEYHLESMRENNRLLYTMDILATLKQSLKHACRELELSSTLSQSEAFASFCKEIDMNLTVLYFVLQFNDQHSEQIQKENILDILFDFIVRLKEYFTSLFPLRKLMMTIQKLLCITFGELDTDDFKAVKSSIRASYHLPYLPSTSTTTTDEKKRKETMIKCTPEELYNIFYYQSLERYPTFTPTPPPAIISNPLLISSSHTTRLTKAMGLTVASKNVDLPYQTLFPSKNGSNHHPSQQQQQQLKNNGLTMDIRDSAFLAMMEEPYSLKEANKVWMKHLYISVAAFQLLQEKRKAVHRWQHHLEYTVEREKVRKQLQHADIDGDDDHDDKEAEDYMDDDDGCDTTLLTDRAKKLLKEVNRFYANIVPNLQKIVVVFLKLLLSTISINNNGKDSNAGTKNSSTENDNEENSTTVDEADSIRNKEILSKTVSSIILSLLKYFKLSHVLKFEYMSQMLIDCGCMLLILKLIGLQEMPLLASRRSDKEGYSFLEQISGTVATDITDKAKNSNSSETYTNKRTLCWSIQLLRILQMLTKRKNQRISLLVQYKSSAVLKKLLKVGHPTLDRYVLKNLKNQVPLMGRKWRSSNMKTISAIYAHCLTSLNDDWLSRPDNDNKEEYKLEEINLRMLIRLYNGQRYLQHLLPTLDEFTVDDNCTFFKPAGQSTDVGEQQSEPAAERTKKTSNLLLPDYIFHHPVTLEDPLMAPNAVHEAATVVADLEADFKLNYRQWLEKEVYSTDTSEYEEDEDEDEEDDEDEANSIGNNDNKNSRHTNGWDTPLPEQAAPPPMSPEELTREINRIYQEELEREFKEKERKKKELEAQRKEAEMSGWGKPASSGIESTACFDGWGETPVATTFEAASRGDEPSNNTSINGTKTNLSDDDEDVDEVEPDFNPLEGIDWQTLSEEELKTRLSVIEQRTVHRYMNVSLDDEAYLKVVNPLETHLAEDEDGWFVE